MATIQKRPQKNGTIRYRVMIRQSDGFPPVSKTFPTKQEAKDWSKQEGARRRCAQPTLSTSSGYDIVKSLEQVEDLVHRFFLQSFQNNQEFAF